MIWVRGAGEIGSATAISLHRTGFPVLLSEIHPPLAIRRTVTFSDAIMEGETWAAGVTAKYRLVKDITGEPTPDFIPIVRDNPCEILTLRPTLIIDARMIKTYNEDFRGWADHVIGFGPGFIAGQNCHVVIETMRGHDLGKIIFDGAPLPNTGIPGTLGGESSRRVLYAPAAGTLHWDVDFGTILQEGDHMGNINGTIEIRSPLAGIVRGLIHPSVPMKKGLKIADVDPRGEGIGFMNLSDKARSLGRAALEAVLIFMSNNP